MPSLTLSQQDLEELTRIVEDIRHKDALLLVGFFSKKMREQKTTAQTAAADPAPPLHSPQPNGVAEAEAVH